MNSKSYDNYVNKIAEFKKVKAYKEYNKSKEFTGENWKQGITKIKEFNLQTSSNDNRYSSIGFSNIESLKKPMLLDKFRLEKNTALSHLKINPNKTEATKSAKLIKAQKSSHKSKKISLSSSFPLKETTSNSQRSSFIPSNNISERSSPDFSKFKLQERVKCTYSEAMNYLKNALEDLE